MGLISRMSPEKAIIISVIPAAILIVLTFLLTFTSTPEDLRAYGMILAAACVAGASAILSIGVQMILGIPDEQRILWRRVIIVNVASSATILTILYLLAPSLIQNHQPGLENELVGYGILFTIVGITLASFAIVSLLEAWGYSRMRSFFIRKIFYLFITILLIMTFNFFLFRVMPGDPINLIFPRGAPEETKEEWRHLLGLDVGMVEQYINYIIGTFTGDWGVSFRFQPRTPIFSILPPFIQKTLFLSGVGTVLAIFFGVIYGRESAWRKGKLFDRVASTTAVVLYSVPTFLFALFYIMIFAFLFPWWPFQGATSSSYIFDDLDIFGKIADITQHAFLPIMSLVLESLAGFALIVRSSLIDVLTEDYILTAEAKGLEERDILKKHAMPNALLPVVAVIALNVGWIMGGTVMIEYIFTYKGLGYLTWEAVLGYDFPLLQTVFFIEIIAVLAANFIADILNFYLDPRVKI